MNFDYITGGKMYFSSDIPKYEYQDDDGSYAFTTARCSLSCGGYTVFSTDIYYNPVEHVFRLDLRGIISSYMQSKSLSFAEFTVTLDNPETLRIIDTVMFSVVFYRGHILQDPETYLRTHFLNDQDVVAVPQHFSAILSLYAFSDSEVLNLYIRPVGRSCRILCQTLMLSSGLNRIVFSLDQLLEESADDIPAGTIPGFVIAEAGDRSLVFAIRSDRPAFAMIYSNGFNLPECFWSFGSWKRKSSSKAETAKVDGQALAYAISHEDTFELKSHPMNARTMFSGFNFIGRTPAQLALFLGREAFFFEAALTEFSCDNDPFSDELSVVELKADVSRSMGHQRFCPDDSIRIFSNHFNLSFQ